ncbi:MAG: alpha/beta fold hydrolase [Pirellulales bacterium]
MIAEQFPPFRPHPLLASGHMQTLAGVLLPGPRLVYSARQHRLPLGDGDVIVLHDDCPPDWQAGGRTALLIHGLAGCHQSGYMQRVAAKLSARGVRCFRMDLRGCGAGFGLARLPYHSGRSEDAAAALDEIARLAPGSPTMLVGFSLGGNIALKLAGELAGRGCGNLDGVVAVCPPVDLAAAVERLRRLQNRLYDRHFVKLLMTQLRQRCQALGDSPTVDFVQPPKRLWEFDEFFTAPVCGFGTAGNYYRLCSSAQFVPRIRLPTLIIASRDDPLVPSQTLQALPSNPAVRLHLASHGGHLGFVGRLGHDADRRWLDWRIVEHIAR